MRSAPTRSGLPITRRDLPQPVPLQTGRAGNASVHLSDGPVL
ncbi:hypothetical protein [Ruegeria profundi]|nr:hypothetical protein [Ruegeria profundi]